MLWQMRHSKYEAHYRKWEEEGRASPLKGGAAPRLRLENAEAWECWWELHATRGAGFGGPEPIRHSEIAALLDLRGVRGQDREDVAHLVRALDLAWLEEKATTTPARPAKPGKKG